MMEEEINEMDEQFFKKYTEEAEKDGKYLYEYKTGEFHAGEVVGMVTTPNQCEGYQYNYPKDNGTDYIQILEFFGEEWYRENDLQFPFCSSC